MTAAGRDQEVPPYVPRCSFCNSAEREAHKLIAGPNAMICESCVDMCLGIILDTPDSVPRPVVRAKYQELKAELAADAAHLGALLLGKTVTAVGRDNRAELTLQFDDGRRLRVQSGRYATFSIATDDGWVVLQQDFPDLI